MTSLELKCFNCKDEIQIELSIEEYDYYLDTGFLIEGSDSYHNLFDRYGWVLQQSPFCDICKYEHSEVYGQDS